MKKVLEIKNICKTYQAPNGEIDALKNISWILQKVFVVGNWLKNKNYYVILY